MVNYVNPANHAPGTRSWNWPTPYPVVICSHRLIIKDTLKIFGNHEVSGLRSLNLLLAHLSTLCSNWAVLITQSLLCVVCCQQFAIFRAWVEYYQKPILNIVAFTMKYSIFSLIVFLYIMIALWVAVEIKSRGQHPNFCKKTAVFYI